MGIRIYPLGDSALTVEFGQTISVSDNEKAIALSQHFQAHPFPGFIESLPAYASTTVFYDVTAAEGAGVSAFDIVSKAAALRITVQARTESRVIEIPAFFDVGSAPDAADIAVSRGLSRDEVIDIFTARTYRVYMLGFLPGFAYMGTVDPRIATGRRQSPRAVVPKGSIGIAGDQAGIYSLESPGGWQIIGRTDLETFLPDSSPPSLLRAGDTVRFVPV